MQCDIHHFFGAAAGDAAGEAFAVAAFAAGLGDALAPPGAGLADAAALAPAAGEAAGLALAAGETDGLAAGAGVGTVEAAAPSRTTDFGPLKPGKEKSSAISINVMAAITVAFSSGFCAPRGPKAD